MKFITLLSLALITFSAQAQDTVESIIEKDAAEAKKALNPNTNPKTALPINIVGDGIESTKMASCLTIINGLGAIKTDEFGSTGEDHFIFRSPNPRSFLYLNISGMYDCSANWPKNPKTKLPDVQFTIDGKLMQPFGPSSNDLKELAGSCKPVGKDDIGIQKFRNRIATNLKYIASVKAKSGMEKKTLKLALRGSCGFHPDFDKYINEGYGSALPDGVTVQGGASIAP